MHEPDPKVIRMISDGLRFQHPGIPNDVVLPHAATPDHWVEKPAEFREPADHGLEGHRGSDRLDDNEPAARRDEWQR